MKVISSHLGDSPVVAEGDNFLLLIVPGNNLPIENAVYVIATNGPPYSWSNDWRINVTGNEERNRSVSNEPVLRAEITT